MSKKTKKRIEALLPGGLPRYVRVYDDDKAKMAPYTIVFTGRKGGGAYLLASEEPFTPQGHYSRAASEDGRPIDVNDSGFSPAVGRRHPHLGLHIEFSALPEKLRRAVIQEYCDLWDLPSPLNDADTADMPAISTDERPTMNKGFDEHMAEQGIYPVTDEQGRELSAAQGPSGLPGPGTPEFDKMFQPNYVEILRHDGELGQTKPTQAAFDLVAQEGEVTCRAASAEEHDGLAQAVYRIIYLEGQRDERNSDSVVVAIVEKGLLLPGVAWDLDMARQFVEERLAGATMPESLLDSVFYAFEQLKDDPASATEYGASFQAVHLKPWAESNRTALCGIDIDGGIGPELKFITIERFKQVGPPPYTHVCIDCLDALNHLDAKRRPDVVVSEDEMQDILAQQGLGPSVHVPVPEGLTSSDWSEKPTATPTKDMWRGVFEPPRTTFGEALSALAPRLQAEIDILREVFRDKFGVALSAGGTDHRAYWWEHYIEASGGFGVTQTTCRPYCLVLVRVRDSEYVHYALVGPGPIGPATAEAALDVIWAGTDFQPRLSNREHPIGHRAAAELLQYLVTRPCDESELSGRQQRFYDDGEAQRLEEGLMEELLWADQYDEPVPHDLIALPTSTGELEEAQAADNAHEVIMRATWYEIEDTLFASLAALDDAVVGASPSDLGLEYNTEPIMRVDDALKRYSTEDGYYHA